MSMSCVLCRALVAAWSTGMFNRKHSSVKHDLNHFRSPVWSYILLGTALHLGVSAQVYGARNAPLDFDGDGTSDIGYFYPPDGIWFINKSQDGFWTTNYAGGLDTKPIAGDFDGDGYCDYGTYSASNGLWLINLSTGGERTNHFGTLGSFPVTGDFDGDRKTDYGCYYPSEGAWSIFRSSTSSLWTTNQFGHSETISITGDFDGDGISDPGYYCPSNGTWSVIKSSTSTLWTTNNCGYEGTIPVTGDFDGDGLDDIGYYYPPDGAWYLFKSQDGYWTSNFGYAGTVPVTGDYDGDGICDFGCYYAPSGAWYIYKSRDGFWTDTFGYAGTQPIQKNYAELLLSIGSTMTNTSGFVCTVQVAVKAPNNACWTAVSTSSWVIVISGSSGTGSGTVMLKIGRNEGDPRQTTVWIAGNPYRITQQHAERSRSCDFDGDGTSDIGYYYAPTGSWTLYMSYDGFRTSQFGYSGTIPVTGDFDGDGICDFGCYYAPLGAWYIYKSRDGFWASNFGYDGTVPVTGDFDGDGICDFGCYYAPSGAWYIYKSRDKFSVNNFGYEGTVPVTGDFDGDGIDDFGCYYARSGNWYIYKSHDGFWATKFGYEGTIPVTGDFDGDGIDDFGCYYAPGGNWYLYKSQDGFWANKFGYEGTVPVTGDYDGDGICDFGCYYAPGGNWYLYKSKNGFWATNSVGYSGTVPVGGSYVAPSTWTPDSVPLTWEPGKSIGPINLGDSYAAVRGELGVPSEIRRTTNDNEYTLWTDYDSVGLSICYGDIDADGQLNDNEIVDGIFSYTFLNPPLWNYQGIQFGSSVAEAKTVLGEPTSFLSTSTSLWWPDIGVMLMFSETEGLDWIYVYWPIRVGSKGDSQLDMKRTIERLTDLRYTTGIQ